MSRKYIKKQLKKDKSKLKSNNYCGKLVRKCISNNVHNNRIETAVAEAYGLPSSSFWPAVKRLPLHKIPSLTGRVITDVVKRRGDIKKATKATILADLEAVNKFYDKALHSTKEDTSAAAKVFVNALREGKTGIEAFTTAKDQFNAKISKETLIGVNTGNNTRNNNNNNNNRNIRKFGVKLCRDFNFKAGGCTQTRCRFFSGHMCAFCLGGKRHSLRNCTHPNLPNMVIGRNMALPPQNNQRQRP